MSSGDVKQSSSNIIIIKLKRGGEEMKSSLHWSVNLLLCFLALCFLYGYYFLFCWVWLVALENLGEDLLWGYFGCFCAVGGGMIVATAYSMASQKIGWWEEDPNESRDQRGKLCGFNCY